MLNGKGKALCAAVSLLAFGTCAEPLKIGGMEFSYAVDTAPNKDLEDYKQAEIRVVYGKAVPYKMDTSLTPGCSELGPITKLSTKNGEVALLCGSFMGRHETLMAFANHSGVVASSILSLGEASAKYQKYGDNYYFLTSRKQFGDVERNDFTVYKIVSDENTFGFVAATRDEALPIFKATLENLKNSGVKNPKVVENIVGIIEKAGRSVEEKCGLARDYLDSVESGSKVNAESKIKAICKEAK